MTDERLRLFKGSTELNYEEAVIDKSNDYVISKGSASIEANSVVVASSVIDFKKNDGSTTVFSAKVLEKKQELLWELELLANGFELNNLPIEKVYLNTSPEDIVKDVVDTFTVNLTYASTATSGFTIGAYIARAYAIDVIKEMMDILEWQLRIDESDNVFFEPPGEVDNGVTLTNGDGTGNFQVTSWNEDRLKLVNHVKIIGGQVSFNTSETLSGINGSKTVFDLDHAPIGSVKAVIDSSELEPTVESSPFVVDPDSDPATITFVTPPSSTGVVDYSFQRPAIVEDQDDASIAAHGKVFEEVPAPFVSSFSDARKFAAGFISAFSQPLDIVKGFKSFLDFDLSLNEKIFVVDNVRSKTATLIIQRLTYNAKDNTTSIVFGTRPFEFFDWQRKVEDRIKKIERSITSEDIITFARTFKHNLSVTLSVVQTNKFKFFVDSFILGHQTLGRLRTNLNFEADCSDTGNSGTWQGSGISGSQYDILGWRNSMGSFNGSDNFIQVSDVAGLRFTGDFSIAFAIKVASLPGALTYVLNKWDGTDGYAVRIAADDKLELIYSDSGADSTIKASTALTAGDFQHVVFTKIGTALTVYINGSSDNTDTGGATVGSNTDDFEVGRWTTEFFTGDLDEVRLYSSGIAASDITDLVRLKQVDTNLVCYLSMDNPKLGDRTTPQLIHTASTSGLISGFRFDLSSTDAEDGISTADWDTTNERIVMDSSSNKNRAYNTLARSKQAFIGGHNIDKATFTSTETKFGNDIILYYLSADGGSNWEEVTNAVEHTFVNQGNDLRGSVAFNGNGANATYVENPTIAFTRTA